HIRIHLAVVPVRRVDRDRRPRPDLHTPRRVRRLARPVRVVAQIVRRHDVPRPRRLHQPKYRHVTALQVHQIRPRIRPPPPPPPPPPPGCPPPPCPPPPGRRPRRPAPARPSPAP